MPAIEADILIYCYCLRSTQYKLEAHYCDFFTYCWEFWSMQ